MQQEVREPTIVVRGDVPDQMVEYAREKALAVLADVRAPVLDVELRLDHHSDPARERPNHVEITVNLDGVPVRARRSDHTMPEAVDRALARFRRRVEAASERPRARRLRHRDESWHHDDVRTERRHVFPRPREERTVVRRKTFALRAESIAEALVDLETLDHDFFLFVHDETNAEAVVYRDGGECEYGLLQCVATPEAVTELGIPLALGPPPTTRALENAVAVLDETDAPFEFFVEQTSGRGQVAYRRYDGHYGLIVPG